MKDKISTLKELLKKLSEDPMLKDAINELKRKSSDGAKLETHQIILTVSQVLIVSLGFFRRGKKAAVLLEAIVLIASLSLLVKKNLFDRPEVQQFFRDNWAGLKKHLDHFLNLCRESVTEMINKAKSLRS